MSKTELEAAVAAQDRMRSALDGLNTKIGDDLKVVLGSALEPLKAIAESVSTLEYRPQNADVAVNILMQLQYALQQLDREQLVHPPHLPLPELRLLRE